MTYLPEESQIIYRSKDHRCEKAFDVSKWLAAMISHIPNLGEQMVRLYGFYGIISRGTASKRKRRHPLPYVLGPDENKKTNRNYACIDPGAE